MANGPWAADSAAHGCRRCSASTKRPPATSVWAWARSRDPLLAARLGLPPGLGFGPLLRLGALPFGLFPRLARFLEPHLLQPLALDTRALGLLRPCPLEPLLFLAGLLLPALFDPGLLHPHPFGLRPLALLAGQASLLGLGAFPGKTRLLDALLFQPFAFEAFGLQARLFLGLALQLEPGLFRRALGALQVGGGLRGAASAIRRRRRGRGRNRWRPGRRRRHGGRGRWRWRARHGCAGRRSPRGWRPVRAAARPAGVRRRILRMAQREGGVAVGVLLLQLEALADPRQLAAEHAQILVATLGRLLQALVDGADDPGVEARNQHGCRLGLGVHDLVEHVRHFAREGALVGEDLVQHRPDGEHVAAQIDGATAGDLLRRHVVDGADEHAVRGQPGPGHADDAEVEDLQRTAVAVDHQVGRLDVAMDHARLVGVGQTRAQALHHLELAHERDRLAAPNQLRQRLAADELHRDERPALEDAELVDRDDVRMREAAGGAGLALEALAHLLVVEALAQELDRDGAIERGIAGEIDVAHPAALDEALDGVLADDLGQYGRQARLSARMAWAG